MGKPWNPLPTVGVSACWSHWVCSRRGCPIKHLLSWTANSLPQEQEKSPKQACFCQRKSIHLFVDMGPCVLGKIWEWLGLRYWGGLSSHAEGFLFQKTIVWTVIDQEKEELVTIMTNNYDKNEKMRRLALSISLAWVLWSSERAVALLFPIL